MVPAPIVIGRQVWRPGASVTVVPGVTIVAGVPARAVRPTGFRAGLEQG